MTERSARSRKGVLAILLAAVTTCTPQTEPAVPGPVSGPGPGGAVAPDIRIGLLIGAARVRVDGDSGLTVLDGYGAVAAEIDPGAGWSVTLDGGQLSAGAADLRLPRQSTIGLVPARSGGLVLVNGRAYRGRLSVFRDRTGLTVVNHVGLEDYLAGVVPAELGRREPSEAEALAAQAIMSRTFAIRNRGKRAVEGFDLYATVVDQVYGGVTAEYPLASAAVGRTAGQILTWHGAPIDAFFFSTCGGRTADGTEVYVGADRPYLRSVRDADASGRAWCQASPRFRWREEWTVEQLRATMRQSLPPASGTSAELAGTIAGIAVSGRTGSDRVAQLTLLLRTGAVQVSGPAVRQVLRPVGQPLLRSAVFQLSESRVDGQLVRLVADGGGAGHGVGFCQWGAVGRARAGQDAFNILAAYLPGTEISRAY